MDLVNKSGKFSKKFESFTGTSDPLGKKLNNMKTREELRWEPKYPSFAQFLGCVGRDKMEGTILVINWGTACLDLGDAKLFEMMQV
ncbi:hypothetical protein CsSME_00033302 [Camellia sinensis var. sinensis]